MAKQSKKTWPYYGVEYASKEELEFAAWLREAEKAGLIKNIRYQPQTYVLATAYKIQVPDGYKTKDRTIARKIVYTPDWDFEITKEFLELFPRILIYDKKTMIVVVDVKGRGGLHANASYYTFPVKQAWLLQHKGIYVNKVVGRPMKKDLKITKLGFFLETFVPKDIMFDKRKKQLTKISDFDNKHCRTLDQIINF